jgi:hypothetical protein
MARGAALSSGPPACSRRAAAGWPRTRNVGWNFYEKCWFNIFVEKCCNTFLKKISITFLNTFTKNIGKLPKILTRKNVGNTSEKY